MTIIVVYFIVTILFLMRQRWALHLGILILALLFASRTDLIPDAQPYRLYYEQREIPNLEIGYLSFPIADIAIGCLACHRKKVKSVKSLKNVEYAARGVLFTYSENNADFDTCPYILKQNPDETPIVIESLISFIKENRIPPIEIRQSVDPKLSWRHQMEIVSESIISQNDL